MHPPPLWSVLSDRRFPIAIEQSRDVRDGWSSRFRFDRGGLGTGGPGGARAADAGGFASERGSTAGLGRDGNDGSGEIALCSDFESWKFDWRDGIGDGLVAQRPAAGVAGRAGALGGDERATALAQSRNQAAAGTNARAGGFAGSFRTCDPGTQGRT